MNGDVVEDKPNASPRSILENGTIGIVTGDIREVADPREIIQYTYRVVYAQESIRMLDLRFDFTQLCDAQRTRELLGFAIRRITDTLK